VSGADSSAVGASAAAFVPASDVSGPVGFVVEAGDVLAGAVRLNDVLDSLSPVPPVAEALEVPAPVLADASAAGPDPAGAALGTSASSVDGVPAAD
jgi:hypothetical protein